MKRIFFVEDDLSLIGGLSFALKKQGYEIDIARTSMEAEQLWQDGTYDLVILDVALPDGSGYDLCRKIREHRGAGHVPDRGGRGAPTSPWGWTSAATIILPSLQAGGIPFPRQCATSPERKLQPDRAGTQPNGIKVLQLKREVYKNGAPIDLTASEYKLLCLVHGEPGHRAFAGADFGRLWDCEENYIDSSTLTVYIRRLRTKIEDDPANPQNGS